MKKAIHLLNSLKHGGAESVALNYVKIMNDLFVKSTFVGRKESDVFVDKLMNYGDVQEVINKKLIQEADYIFIHSNANLFALVKFIPLLKKQKKKVFYIQHLNYPYWKFLILSRLINLVCTDFIQITTITSKLVKRFINVNIIFLVNFYLNEFEQSSWDDIKRNKRKELNIPMNVKVIMFSAVFKPGKGLQDMLDLIYYCNKSNKDYFYLIVGDGIENHLIKNFSLKDRLIWTGFVTGIEEYLLASDIYFFSSRFELEMMPMALIEAINLEKQILAYKTEINDFLLNDTTCNTMNQVLNNLNNEIFPKKMIKYDYEYAFNKFNDILN